LITHSTSISTQINLPGRLSSTQPLSVVARPPPVDPLRSQLLIFSPSVVRRCASVRHVLPVDPAVHRDLVHVLVDVADPSSSQTSSADAPNEPSRRRADAARHAHVKLLHRIEMRWSSVRRASLRTRSPVWTASNRPPSVRRSRRQFSTRFSAVDPTSLPPCYDIRSDDAMMIVPYRC